MKKVAFALLVLTLAASPGWAAGLTLTIRNGKVSLDAQDVTIRQILTEWARVGKTRIVNLERVTSGPMTLKLEGVPEDQALDIILRTVPGYMAAPRATVLQDASMYDRILIMPTTSAVAPRPVSAGAQPAPQFPFPGASPNVTRLRPPPGMTPGALPDSANDDDRFDLNDPAISAAAAAGLVAIPAPGGGAMPFTRVPGTVLGATPPAAPTPQPSPMPTAPAGTAQPGPPTATPASPLRPGSIAPPQADR